MGNNSNTIKISNFMHGVTADAKLCFERAVLSTITSDRGENRKFTLLLSFQSGHVAGAIYEHSADSFED